MQPSPPSASSPLPENPAAPVLAPFGALDWVRVSGVLAQASVGLGVIDDALALRCANAAFLDALGMEPEADPTNAWIECLAPAAQARLRAALRESRAVAAVAVETLAGCPLQVQLADGAEGARLLLLSAVAGRGAVSGGAAYDALRDPLTGLGNRLLFEETLARWTPQPDSAPLAVLMLDLDRFKQVNDTLGHECGDKLLKLVAKRLATVVRSGDVLARLGGDEFVIIQHDGEQPRGAESAAGRIVELLSRPFLVEGQQVNIGCSVGIAVFGLGSERTEDLLKHADLALYQAKDQGRGTYRLFEPALAERALARRELEIDLRRALRLDQFHLVYQPQVDLRSGAVTGFEALLRWQHPERGLVAPLDFIPLAEEIGEIHAITRWTIRQACREASNWPDPLTVAVNVSPVQFGDDEIVDVVRRALAEHGLPASRLQLEITENVLITDQDKARNVLWALKNLGVDIVMDDFGTGYSSLSYLHSFPFTKIKIDQSFIRGEASDTSTALVAAILSLGDSLGMATIAEGVETRDQLDGLVLRGCAEAQGYLISKPIPPQDIAAFMQSYQDRRADSHT